MKKLIVISLILSNSSLYADIYDDHVKLDQGFNHKFVRNIAESRAHEGQRESEKYKDRYMVVDGNEEFQEALEDGQFDTDLTDSSRIEKEYIYRDIKNVNIDDSDLEGLEGDTLNLGSNIDGGNVMQSLNIENSNIETDRELSAGITTTSSDISDITSITQIKDSKLSGGGSDENNRISTSQDFDK
jgi:hypothetical protein